MGNLRLLLANFISARKGVPHPGSARVGKQRTSPIRLSARDPEPRLASIALRVRSLIEVSVPVEYTVVQYTADLQAIRSAVLPTALHSIPRRVASVSMPQKPHRGCPRSLALGDRGDSGPPVGRKNNPTVKHDQSRQTPMSPGILLDRRQIAPRLSEKCIGWMKGPMLASGQLTKNLDTDPLHPIKAFPEFL